MDFQPWNVPTWKVSNRMEWNDGRLISRLRLEGESSRQGGFILELETRAPHFSYLPVGWQRILDGWKEPGDWWHF
jgi:hypothetical protein